MLFALITSLSPVDPKKVTATQPCNVMWALQYGKTMIEFILKVKDEKMDKTIQDPDKQNLYRFPWSMNDNPQGWVEVTDICNLHCRGCYRQRLEGHKLSWSGRAAR